MVGTAGAVVPADLRLKHRMMTQSAFSFLPGDLLPVAAGVAEVCADLTAAPRCGSR